MGLTIQNQHEWTEPCTLCKWYETKKGRMMVYREGNTYFYYGSHGKQLGMVTIVTERGGNADSFTVPIAKVLNFAEYYEKHKEEAKSRFGADARQLTFEEVT